jgi:transcriptional regulator of acetoin/glycerol metabolism
LPGHQCLLRVLPFDDSLVQFFHWHSMRKSAAATEGNDRVWDLAFINVNWFEAANMRNLLERCGGNISRASEVADIDRKTFYRLLRKHNLQRPNHPKTERSVQAGSRVA